MSSYVEVRGVKIGEGVPKICVPIVGKTKEEILAAAKSFADVKMDVVEWRVDWFDGVFDFAQVEDVLKDLRPALGNTPILFSFPIPISSPVCPDSSLHFVPELPGSDFPDSGTNSASAYWGSSCFAPLLHSVHGSSLPSVLSDFLFTVVLSFHFSSCLNLS